MMAIQTPPIYGRSSLGSNNAQQPPPLPTNTTSPHVTHTNARRVLGATAAGSTDRQRAVARLVHLGTSFSEREGGLGGSGNRSHNSGSREDESSPSSSMNGASRFPFSQNQPFPEEDDRSNSLSFAKEEVVVLPSQRVSSLADQIYRGSNAMNNSNSSYGTPTNPNAFFGGSHPSSIANVRTPDRYSQAAGFPTAAPSNLSNVNVTVFLPTEMVDAIHVVIKKTTDAQTLIATALNAYNTHNRKPDSLMKLPPTSFRLYISESDGEVDEDFPPLDRACLVASTGATTFALRLAPTANGNPVRKGSYSESLEDESNGNTNNANEISRVNSNSKEKRRRGERYQQQHDSDIESDDVTLPRTSSSADLHHPNATNNHQNNANGKQQQSNEDGGKKGFFACCLGLFGKKKSSAADEEADRRAAHVSARNSSINGNNNASAPFSSINSGENEGGRVRGSSTSQIVGHTVRTSSMDGPLPYLPPALPSTSPTSPPAPSHGLQHQAIPPHMARSSSQNALNIQRQLSDTSEYDSEESVNVGNAFAKQTNRHRNGSALEAALDDDGRI